MTTATAHTTKALTVLAAEVTATVRAGEASWGLHTRDLSVARYAVRDPRGHFNVVSPAIAARYARRPGAVARVIP